LRSLLLSGARGETRLRRSRRCCSLVADPLSHPSHRAKWRNIWDSRWLGAAAIPSAMYSGRILKGEKPADLQSCRRPDSDRGRARHRSLDQAADPRRRRNRLRRPEFITLLGGAAAERSAVSTLRHRLCKRRGLVQRVVCETEHAGEIRSEDRKFPDLAIPRRWRHRAQHGRNDRRQCRDRQQPRQPGRFR
jgi:hypothetical protein